MSKIKAFLKLSRIPFLLPGLAPFTAGVLLGIYHQETISNHRLLMLGYAGLTLIMLITYYSNEYFDYEGDVINKNFNKFSGGSRVFPEGLLPREVGVYLIVLSLTLFSALFLLYVKYYYHIRPYLLPLSLIGLFFGFFYSAPPFKWAYKGVGEILIGISYGWLATVSGYYIVTGKIDLGSTLLSLPAAFTVFSVIVINEVPDYEADLKVQKRNLVVRLGTNKAKILYLISNVLALVSATVAGMYLGGLIGALMTLAILSPLLLYPIYVLLENSHLDDRLLEALSKVTIISNALATYPVLFSLIFMRWWL